MAIYIINNKIFKLQKEMNIMFNRNNGAFWGTVIGTSLGIIISSRMKPFNSRKMMKLAKKVKSNVIDGMSSLWD